MTHRRPSRRAFLGVEPLEDRCLMAYQLNTLWPILDHPFSDTQPLQSTTGDISLVEVLQTSFDHSSSPRASAPLMRLSVEGLDAGKTQEVILQSFQWGVAAGPNGGAPVVRDLEMILPTTGAAPRFAQAAADGRHLTRATLTMFDARDTSKVLSKWTLEDVVVTSYQTLDADLTSTTALTDRVSLQFGRITQEYFGPDKGAKPIKVSYDATKGGGTTASFLSYQATTTAPRIGLVIDEGGARVSQEIALDGFGWAERAVDPRKDGTADLDEFQLVLQSGAAAPAFFSAAVTGVHLRKATILVRGPRDEILQRWTLEDVTVRSFETGDLNDAAGASGVDSVTLGFTKIASEYTPPKGATGKTSKASWDAGKGAGGSSSSFGDFKATDRAPLMGLQIVDTSRGTTDGEIPLQFWHWAESSTAAGQLSMGDFTATMATSAASPAFFFAGASGVHLQKAIITMRNTRGEVFQRWTLEDVTVSNYQVADTNDGKSAPATENVSLNFGKITHEFLAEDGSGKAGKLIKASWDQGKGTGGGASFSEFRATDAAPAIGLEVIDGSRGTQGAIPVESLAWGEDSNGPTGLQLHDFQVVVKASTASPAFFSYAATGQHLPKVVLSIRNTKDVVYQRWTLEDVTVSAFQSSDANDKAINPATDTLTLRFQRITQEYNATDAHGKITDKARSSWDRSKGQGSSSSFNVFKATEAAPRIGLEIRDGSNSTVGEIPLAGYHWTEVAVDNAATTGNLQVQFRANAASPAFFGTAASGRHLQEANLVVRDAKGNVIQRWALEDVTVRSYVTGDERLPDGEAALETVSLGFGRITQEYLGLDSSGQIGKGKATWDAAKGQTTTPRFDDYKATGAAPLVGLRINHLGNNTQGEIPVASFNWAEMATLLAGRRQLIMTDFSLHLPATAASPAFMAAAASGMKLEKVVLTVRDAKGQIVQRWTLDRVVVTAYASALADPTGTAVEEIMLRFDRIELEQTSNGPDGKPQLIKFRWDKGDDRKV